jgi:hypothetical protein
MDRPAVADEEHGLQRYRIVQNAFKKQPRPIAIESSFRSSVEFMVKNHSLQNILIMKRFTKTLEMGEIVGI